MPDTAAAHPKTLHRDAARRALLDTLDAIRGRKALVLEGGFAAPLGLVADALTLKEHGVEVCVVWVLWRGLRHCSCGRCDAAG